MGFLIEIWPITLTTIFVFILIFVSLKYRLPASSAPENMWQHANRYETYFPGLKGKLIKNLLKTALLIWPIVALANLLIVLKVIK